MVDDWSNADATSVRTFLAQPVGQKWLRRIRANIPKIRAKKIETVTLEAVEKQGAEDLYEFMLSHADEISIVSDSIVNPVDLTIEGD
jgi:hypothetical protein